MEGKTYRNIAAEFDCKLANFHRFISKEEHCERVKMALSISATTYANKGEEVLINADSDRNEIQRANCLAQYYKWMAGKRNPKEFGDSSLIKIGNPEGKEIKINAIFDNNLMIIPSDDSSKKELDLPNL